MKKLKWYNQSLILFFIIVTSPFWLIFSIFCRFFKTSKEKKEYIKSKYYNKFKKKYRKNIIYSPEYRFYNLALFRNLPIEYIKQDSNGLEYFIYNKTIFLFPNFEKIELNEEKTGLQVYLNKKIFPIDEVFSEIVSKLDNANGFPIKILIERKMISIIDISNIEIPDYIFLTWNYEFVFEDNNSQSKMIIPQTTKQLYELMLKNKNLCGKFEFSEEDNMLKWNLFENIIIEISVEINDCYFGINEFKLGEIGESITHWHPDIFEVYDEVCKAGKKGNILIIKKSFGSSEILYLGNKETCPYPFNKKYYYLEIN